MNTQRQLVLTVMLLFVSILSAQIKVACIGNSITYGAGVVNREKNSYPAQLQEYLGDEYQVENFGVSACTLLKSGNHPYIKTDTYQKSLEFNPHIVIIKLGTNDSKPYNIKYKEQLKGDYQSLIDSYLNLPTHPRIILVSPIKCFLVDSEIDDTIIRGEVVPLIQELAIENNLELIDLYRIFGKSIDGSLLPDHLHPSSIGAGMMSRYIYDYLQVERQEALPYNDKHQFNFYGFKGYEFQHEGVSCKIVEPKRVAKGKPWVLRARFWGHEPQFDIKLLEQGFHIAYCDVADLYGSQVAINRWNEFYSYMMSKKFHSKVVLEGMSRGGLIIYNWANQNPEKVACIYADAPVLDLKSWPLGQGKAKRYEADIAMLLGNSDDTDRRSFLSPIDEMKAIAENKIPIIHVLGESDSVVFPDENTYLFQTKLEELGHEMTIISKPKVGHHPHSLFNPKPIVDFVFKAMGRTPNYCALAVPGNEYRSGAGWVEGVEWHKVADDITSTLQGKKLDVLFFGNSITQGLGGTRELVSYKPGKKVMDAILGENNWEAAGISGDKVENLIWRIRNIDYSSCQAKNIVLTIGVNNIATNNDSASDIAEGIKVLTDEVVKKFPYSKVILLGTFPLDKNLTDKRRVVVTQLHQYLSEYDWGKVEYINPTSWFTTTDGTLKTELYSGDLLHLNEVGYKVWGENIKNKLKK